MRARALMLAVALLVLAADARAEVPSAGALEQRVRGAVEPLLPRFGQAAVVVAVVEPDGERVFGFGRTEPGAREPRAPDGSTLFEIGSITKLFTALLLAEMTLRGELDLDDPVHAYLPPALRPPEPASRPISLRDLVTHRSGLGYLPLDMPAMRRERGEKVAESESIGHPGGARYPRKRLAADLPHERLLFAPGERFAYSPLGYGLLGIALGERAGKPFAKLLRERVLAPLGLIDSEMMAEARAPGPRYAQGHDDDGRARFFRSDDEALAACCGLRASARDLARFLRLQFDAAALPSATLRRALAFSQLPQRLGGHTHAEHIGLGWHLLQRPRGQSYKLGQMAGHRAFVEVNLEQRRGVVVLAAHAAFPVEDVAHALLPREQLAVQSATQLLPAQRADEPRTPRARWSDGLELHELSVPARVRAGERLSLRLRLRATQAVKRSYALFIHAESAAGRLIADHAPQLGTDRWPVGEWIEHRVTFDIPADYPSGPLQLWLGWFDAQGRARVESGQSDGSDRVRGTTVTVVRAP